VFHYREDRIRAKVELCWLALLLARVAENATGGTWRNLRHELGRMHLVGHPRHRRRPRRPAFRGHPRLGDPNLLLLHPCRLQALGGMPGRHPGCR